MDPIKEALTFDDVTLAPQYPKVLPSDVSTRTVLSNQLKLDIPILSSAMDTVTESKMAIAVAREGGIGVIHRNLTIAQQISEIKKVKSKNLNGIDSLLSIVQMPPGVPVGTLAIGNAGAQNAALLAASIIATSDDEIAKNLKIWRKNQTQSVKEYPSDE